MKEVLTPYYPHSKIRCIRQLATLLEITEGQLMLLVDNCEQLYKSKRRIKKDGALRTTYAPSYRLKRIQRNINQKILKRVVFPSYLHGSVPARTQFSNASAHVGAKTLVKLDIAKFFDFIAESSVFSVFSKLLKFPRPVAQALTALTTLNGVTPQGAPTSSYLAQLVFFDDEPILVKRLQRKSLIYTRYVDDISISSRASLSGKEIGIAIGLVRSMCGAHGFRLKDKKESICRVHGRRSDSQEFVRSGGGCMDITGVRLKPGVLPTCIPKQYRRSVVSAVRWFSRQGQDEADLRNLKESLTGKIGYIRALHPVLAAQLLARLKR